MNQKKRRDKKQEFRKLEDLNLIDDFLFQQMLLQEEDGEEFVRILLSTILEKPIRKVKIIPQRDIIGLDTDKHGIRLDAYIKDVSEEVEGGESDAEVIPKIYDIEPNRTHERESLPKRMRYYQSLMDVQLLSAGANYKKLPEVAIIMILPYDPFNQNRMVYTISNQCEEQDLKYWDGVKKIFLYTKGIEGNPSQALKDMLQYIERTVEDNVTNQNIDTIHRMVNKVKKKKEVGINYMKSWEIEEMVREEGYQDGMDTINDLIICLSEAGRTDDIIKAARDAEYREKLLEEFDLV